MSELSEGLTFEWSMLGAASNRASFLKAPVPPNSSRWLLTMQDASHAYLPVYLFHLPSGPCPRIDIHRSAFALHKAHCELLAELVPQTRL